MIIIFKDFNYFLTFKIMTENKIINVKKIIIYTIVNGNNIFYVHGSPKSRNSVFSLDKVV